MILIKIKSTLNKYSDLENALKYWDKNSIFLLRLYLKPMTNELSSDEESEMIPDEDPIPNHVPDQEIEKSNSRNNKVFSNGYDEYSQKQEEEKDLELIMENSKINDNYFKKYRGSVGIDILKPASFTLLTTLDSNAKPKKGSVMGWLSRKTTSLISSETPEEKQEYAVVNDKIEEYSNEDIVLAIPGSVVK